MRLGHARAGSLSIHVGLDRRGTQRLRDLTPTGEPHKRFTTPYVLVYFRQKRRFPPVRGRDMLSPERVEECRRLISGELRLQVGGEG